ncbi:UDP-N-acetylmuramoyl-L-alanyl-D-glutamate--2,6-diaminopimelate ligase [Dyadobacter sediminis]|uniref:UDP-N-acetylmuramoyl-L-alanyl-D-glutamate--2,6-diaminopimelate ligase n=1 Tax=Dyadobacter sediminis TaxID=1493691 RepID=A0A5R9K844_9BACT|nr:UDP-N-acetylmuramoyl-L-alanyl-D-glutamate--2,6-diaminopimelate ligase [Dyadobacter sediminis]TLU89982.1 UDP-N-acetylmuramoyl-L-alanyl-D-glutamate--2,6-diaminopimelate ligase [Dyadobacter sediminis]GGC11156.1 UDP-N-acetylmuramoyl-L-alanyl-D-glutamate--2,6-diaminopimelate ligase [Dyadobacter sediminis]
MESNQEKKLSDLLNGIPVITISGSQDVTISSIIIDSRRVLPGSMFVALRGTQTDGHQFIETTVNAGASAVLCEALPEKLNDKVTYIQTEDSAAAMGMIAAAFYGHPSQKLSLVGVTGTNGKTSVATFLFQLFRALGYRCGLLSTVQNQIEDEIIPSTHTTPDAVALNKLLSEMLEKNCSHVFMEVSSHSVAQHRITGLHFAGGIFTNITHDHLDFHKTFDNYIKAKKGFFDQLPKSAFALVNVDDRRGSVMVQNTRAKVETYSLQTLASFKGKIISDTLAGMHMEINQQEVWFRVIGRFNAYNLLAVYGAALLLGESSGAVLTELSNLKSPPGRFEQFHSADNIVGIVDYAHTPDALENVLETITHLRHGNEKVITVVGCGGNRDAEKRPKMAAIACKYSNLVILTSDNPRYEDPLDILEQMRKGVPAQDYKKTIVIPDRREAIFKAGLEANPEDIILIAGKGHENYQEINGVKHHFDDKEVLLEVFKKHLSN